MKKLLIIGLLYSAAHANISIEGTVLPKSITLQYECLKSKGMLDKAPKEFIEVYENIKAGNFSFHEDTLTKAIPDWKFIIDITERAMKK